MEELSIKIDEQITLFVTNSAKHLNQGNKAAGQRARKATLKLEKLFKQYRKLSVEASK